jgi:small-conductance mechanosensitive channel
VIYNTVRDGDFIPPENEDAAALVNRMEESGIVLRVWVWAETLEASYRLKSDIMLGVHRRFGDEGVRFAYPHVQIIDNPQST